MFTAAVFIIGEMSGTGVLSMPKAMLGSGWAGVAMILGCCVLSAYCGIRLSSCWMIILDKNDNLRHGVRDPYPVIAMEAGGKIGKYLIEVVSYVQLFGVAVIFLLIASHNFANLLNMLPLHFCDWAIIIVVLMIPVAMFGTPKDFWPIAVGAMVFTGFACLLIFIETLREVTTPLPAAKPVTFE
jgi:vesicular inhibitory amino acid transporter